MQAIEQNISGTQPVVIVRLLNGILKGCEYTLPIGKTLFIAADRGTLEAQQALPSFPENSILIPTDSGAANFEVIVDPADEHPLLLRRQDNVQECEEALETNRPVTVGPLELAFRMGEEPWSEAVLNYRSDLRSDTVAPSKTGRGRLAIAALVVLALGASAIVLSLYRMDAQQREIVSLASQLSKEPGKFKILPGSDGMLYALATSERDAAWGRQSLVRLKTSQPVKVASVNDENRRIERWLTLNYPSLRLHQIQLDTPSHPVLLLSRQRGSINGALKSEISAGLLKHLPYAEYIKFEEIDDNTVARKAEEGIRKLAINYTRIDNEDSVTFVINGALNDGERQRIRFFIEQYDRQWSGNYIQFSIEMKDDFLKGRSFKYGHEGFVKMTPGHWYFPNT